MPAPARFSLSGEVLNYGNENWLLPQHVEWITDHAMRDEPDQISDDPNEATETVDVVEPVDDAEEAENRDQGDSIADIVAELQASVGPFEEAWTRATRSNRSVVLPKADCWSPDADVWAEAEPVPGCSCWIPTPPDSPTRP